MSLHATHPAAAAPERSTPLLRRTGAPLAGALSALLAGLLVLWWAAPLLLAPVADFEQGPGGTEAYVTVARQIREQSAAFWTGGDVHLILNEREVSGMLSSALLSGGSPDGPLARVRSSVDDGAIQVDAVVRLPEGVVPKRLSDPLGVRLRLAPEVTETGVIQFRIRGAYLGRVPVSPALIRLAGRFVEVNLSGYDARDAAFALPVSDMVSQALGRRIEIRAFTAEAGRLQMTIAMPEY
jgi:hypothetical protein